MGMTSHRPWLSCLEGRKWQSAWLLKAGMACLDADWATQSIPGGCHTAQDNFQPFAAVTSQRRREKEVLEASLARQMATLLTVAEQCGIVAYKILKKVRWGCVKRQPSDYPQFVFDQDCRWQEKEVKAARWSASSQYGCPTLSILCQLTKQSLWWQHWQVAAITTWTGAGWKMSLVILASFGQLPSLLTAQWITAFTLLPLLDRWQIDPLETA